MPSSTRWALSLLAVLPLGAWVACSSKDSGTPAPAVVAPTATFQPKTCKYRLDHILGAPDFEASTDELGSAVCKDDKDKATPCSTPGHVRTGLGGDVDSTKPGYADPSTSLAVGWQTDVGTRASKLRFGEAADKLTNVVDGTSYVLPQEFGRGPVDGIRFHEVHECGLTPGRTYYYQAGGGPAGKEVWSPVSSITTAPARAAKDPLMFAFAGDSRDALGRTELPVWRAIASRVKVSGARFLLFSGDNVLTPVDQDLWNLWLSASDALSQSMFIATAPGNHENELVRYFAHALMPGTGPNSERYGSFDYGPVHVVMIDDYIGIVAPSIDPDLAYTKEVLTWLDADLGRADANRAAVPWIVVFHHHPVYDSGSIASRVAERKSTHDAFAAKFDKYHVDLDVAGHDHFYERSKSIVADAVAATGAKGTTYVVCAGGGAPSYDTKPGDPLSEKIVHYDPDKLEGIYGLVNVDATSLSVKVLKLVGAGGSSPADDTAVDEFKLAR